MLSAVEMPFERQSESWTCGAAALTMVYRSFGVECRQDEIWSAIGQANPRGRRFTRAQAIAADALRREFYALVIEVRDPWLVLNRCIQQSVRVIINHVSQPKSGGGHYSVLTALGDDEVRLHDPDLGPDRSLTRAEFLQLWNPRAKDTEIVGQVLVAIADSPSRLDECELCHGTADDTAECPACRRPVALQPLAILGCLTDWCPMRAWERIFCPWCDRNWTKGLGGP
jgi:peptidase C39-like protein